MIRESLRERMSALISVTNL